MPSVTQNEAVWGHDYHWNQGGDEWSDPFGGTDELWEKVILPRIGHLLGGRTVEIAPVYGRITAKLLPLVEHLTAVDLNERCIDNCRERFAGSEKLALYTNDGRSLPMVPDRSVDFVVSFDALVHVDEDVMESYLDEIARVLTPSGAAFIHHSNVGSYLNPIGLLGARIRRRVNARTNHNWRGSDVSAATLRAHAHRLGLKLNVAEQITWRSRLLNDCFSLFSWSGDELTTRNYRFFEKPGATAEALEAYRSITSSG